MALQWKKAGMQSKNCLLYTSEEQDSVFGTELVAREVPVTVLDKNEQYVAVEEVISGEVIVSSDKDIAEGSRVKLEEE